MADSLERPSIPKNIGDGPQELKDWIYKVGLWMELANAQGFDLKGNVVDGEIFLNDLPVVGTGTSGTLWNDSNTIKIVP